MTTLHTNTILRVSNQLYIDDHTFSSICSYFTFVYKLTVITSCKKLNKTNSNHSKGKFWVDCVAETSWHMLDF